MTKLSPARVVIRRAIQRLKFNGWRQGPRIEKTFTGWSLSEALIHKNNDPEAVEEALEAVAREIRWLEGPLGEQVSAAVTIDRYNDDPKRMLKDIAKVLDNALREERFKDDAGLEAEVAAEVAEEGSSFLVSSGDGMDHPETYQWRDLEAESENQYPERDEGERGT